MKIREILFVILVGVLLASTCFFAVKSCQCDKRTKALQAEINALHNAPMVVDTVYDSVEVKGRVIIKPVPVRVEIHDTIFIKETLSWYDSTFSKDGIRFRWAANVTGSINELSFSDFVFPKEVITITKHYDTCFRKPPEYKAKVLHYGLYTEAVLNNFTDFPGVGLGVQGILMDRLTVSVGGVYLNGFYGNLRVGVLLK